MIKRCFLIMVALITLVAFPACDCGLKSGPYNSKPTTTTKVVPKAPEAAPPKVVQPKAVPPVADATPPKTVRPKPKQPRVAIAPKTAPKTEPPVAMPKVEPPKAEPPVAAVPKVEPPKCTPKPAPRVSIVDYWFVQRPSGSVRDLVAFTFVVKNPTPKDAKVKVVCHFADGALFGESIPQTIDAGDDAKLMVKGFWRCPGGISCRESFDCRVEPVV